MIAASVLSGEAAGFIRRFSFVSSFDGYVKELRRNGCIVTFVDPFSCFVRPAK